MSELLAVIPLFGAGFLAGAEFMNYRWMKAEARQAAHDLAVKMAESYQSANAPNLRGPK